MTGLTSEYRLRRAAGTDLARLVEIEHAAHAHPWSEGQLQRELSTAYSTVLCAARVDASVDGTGTSVDAFIVYWVIHDEMHILDVVTAPEARRRGLARTLMTEAMGEAASRGVTRALLEVRRSNAPAIGLYRSLGFLHDTVRRGYYADGEDAVLMSVALGSRA